MRFNSTLLKDAIALASTQSDDFEMVETETGIVIHTISPDHVTMTVVKIPYSEIDGGAYEYNAAMPGRWIMDCSKLLRAVKVAGSDDVELEFIDGACKVVGGGMTSRVPLLIREEGNKRVPQLVPAAMTIIDSASLVRIVKAAGSDDMNLIIHIDANGVRMNTIDDKKNATVTLEIPPEDTAACEGVADTTYSLPAFTAFVNAVPKGAVLTMSLSNEMPVVITYATDQHLDAKWLAAPIIDSEDD